MAGATCQEYPSSVIPVRVPCTGRVDVKHIIKAFRDGADAVMVVGCLEGNCNYQFGNIEARKRVEQARELLSQLGIDGERVEMFNIASNQGWRFAEAAREMASRVSRLGPVFEGRA
ncbi:MAG: hydrogenase iron-sulfur subunit [Methanomassiliicoccales archaeon]|nr:MAG: hydrogenase iron-sulfur subunit [Methanomassiliicoccales archaeon]